MTSAATELAWAAGFFDGEGSCTVIRRQRKGSATDRDGYRVGPRGGKSAYLYLNVGQTSPEPLERFMNAVGAGKVNGPYLRTGKKPFWTWQVAGQKALKIVDLLRPHLCPPKVAQLDAALKEISIA